SDSNLEIDELVPRSRPASGGVLPLDNRILSGRNPPFSTFRLGRQVLASGPQRAFRTSDRRIRARRARRSCPPGRSGGAARPQTRLGLELEGRLAFDLADRKTIVLGGFLSS